MTLGSFLTRDLVYMVLLCELVWIIFLSKYYLVNKIIRRLLFRQWAEIRQLRFDLGVFGKWKSAIKMFRVYVGGGGEGERAVNLQLNKRLSPHTLSFF